MALSEPTELNTFHSEINRLLDQFGIWCFWVEKLGGLRFKSKKGLYATCRTFPVEESWRFRVKDPGIGTSGWKRSGVES